MKENLWFAIYMSPIVIVGIIIGVLTSSFIGFGIGCMITILILFTPLCDRWMDYTIKKATEDFPGDNYYGN